MRKRLATIALLTFGLFPAVSDVYVTHMAPTPAPFPGIEAKG